MTHLHWSDETNDGKCPVCGTPTVLIVSWGTWHIPEGGGVHTSEELTAHWCPECMAIRSLALNTKDDKE